MALEYVKSQKGHDLLVHNGFTFRREREHNGVIYWRCTEYRIAKCSGRVNVMDGRIFKSTSHNHVPDPAKIQVRTVIHKIKERATTTQEVTHQIIASSTTLLSSAVCGQLPSVSLMKRTLQRARQQVDQPPPNPTSLTELEFPEKYTKTIDEHPFLLYDSGPSNDRILLFTTQRNLDLMAQSDHWFADGTFKSAPQLFTQVYTIHALKYHTVIPTIYAVMPNKTQFSYNRLFSALKNLNTNLNPTSIMTDFEQSAINSFKEAFPDSLQRGCFFHLSQCLWRRMQQIEGMQQKYSADPEFGLQIKQLAALAYVPEAEVIKSFESLLDSQYYTENERYLQPIIDYFEDTWIGRIDRRNRRRQPLFPISLWNCHEAAKSGLPRTNNSVEGWHRGFNQLLGSSHPTIWKFIEDLHKQQSLNEVIIEQYIAGQHPPASRQVYRDTAQRIEDLVKDYENRNILEFLRGIAHNFKLQV